MNFTPINSWKQNGGINRTSSNNIVRIPSAINNALAVTGQIGYDSSATPFINTVFDSNIIVNGDASFNSHVFINDLTLGALNIENDNPSASITATSKTNQSGAGILTINGSSTAGKENPIVKTGDSVISSNINNSTGGALTLCYRGQLYGSGIRLDWLSNTLYGFTRLQDGTDSPAILGFQDGTEQKTAYSPSITKFPQLWNEGTWYRTGSSVPFNVPSVNAFIQIPSLDVGEYNVNQYSGTSLTLEITYTITAVVNSDLKTEIKYNGYNLVCVGISMQSGDPTATETIDDIINNGDMRNPQGISFYPNFTTTFTPYTINYTDQSNKNGINIAFGNVSISSGNDLAITSYNRSVRIVNANPAGTLIRTQPTTSNNGMTAYFTEV